MLLVFLGVCGALTLAKRTTELFGI
jgi:hypothetical protein